MKTKAIAAITALLAGVAVIVADNPADIIKQSSVLGKKQSSDTVPEVWLCPPVERVMELIAENANPVPSLQGLTCLKLYIGMMKTAERSELEKLVALVRTNNLKVIVEVGGTLNYDWQDQAGEKSAEVELAKLKRWYDAGGTVDYLDLDDPVYRLMGGNKLGKRSDQKVRLA